MGEFRKWIEEMTSTASIATVPMRMLADRGRPYIGIPGGPSPYDKKSRPTVIRRGFPKSRDSSESETSKKSMKFPYKWLNYIHRKKIPKGKK